MEFPRTRLRKFIIICTTMKFNDLIKDIPPKSDSDEIPLLPLAYYGEYQYNNMKNMFNTIPRKWNRYEVLWMKALIDKGYTTEDICLSMKRSEPSIRNKRKKLLKKENNYGAEHYRKKHLTNMVFLEEIEPRTILDLYNGGNPQYSQYRTTTNDMDDSYDCDYHMDAFRLLCKLYGENRTYDFIDLDPYGSAYDCFDLAVKMSKKGLAVTFGELYNFQFRRLDFVKYRYGISSMDEFTLDNMVKKVQEIGIMNKKKLELFHVSKYANIGRAWFKIKPYKVDFIKENKNG